MAQETVVWPILHLEYHPLLFLVSLMVLHRASQVCEYDDNLLVFSQIWKIFASLQLKSILRLLNGFPLPNISGKKREVAQVFFYLRQNGQNLTKRGLRESGNSAENAAWGRRWRVEWRRIWLLKHAAGMFWRRITALLPFLVMDFFKLYFLYPILEGGFPIFPRHVGFLKSSAPKALSPWKKFVWTLLIDASRHSEVVGHSKRWWVKTWWECSRQCTQAWAWVLAWEGTVRNEFVFVFNFKCQSSCGRNSLQQTWIKSGCWFAHVAKPGMSVFFRRDCLTGSLGIFLNQFASRIRFSKPKQPDDGDEANNKHNALFTVSAFIIVVFWGGPQL